MQIRYLIIVLTLYAATASAVQDSSQADSKTAKKDKADKTVTMSGCVSADGPNLSQLTFTDTADGSKYRITGSDTRKYVGQRVEIVGVQPPRKLKIQGGLTPTPNVAAQAGDLDPTRAAVAAAGGGTRGTGTPELPEFRVSRVKAVGGECPR
jgi:hypothetical protein